MYIIIIPIMNNKAFTMIEVLIVSVIIITALGANIIFNEPLRRNLKQLENRYNAVNLAVSQMEDLEMIAEINWGSADLFDTAGAYKAGTADMTIPAGYNITYKVVDKIDWVEDDTGVGGADENDAEYKFITVQCTYPLVLEGNAHTVSVDGYVVEEYDDN